jgi:hypothetical protein
VLTYSMSTGSWVALTVVVGKNVNEVFGIGTALSADGGTLYGRANGAIRLYSSECTEIPIARIKHPTNAYPVYLRVQYGQLSSLCGQRVHGLPRQLHRGPRWDMRHNLPSRFHWSC